MKKVFLAIPIVGVLLAITALPVLAVPPLSVLNRVDIGDTASEVGHHLYGWGPIEKLTHGGGWGGIGEYGTRVTWYSDLDGSQKGDWACTPDEDPDPNDEAGVLTLYNKRLTRGWAKELRMNVLDGIGDDSFEVYVRKPFRKRWVKIGDYTADPSTTEVWKEHAFKLRGIFRWFPVLRVKIVATGEKWAGWCPYGQLAVDWVELLGWSFCRGKCK